MTDPTVPDTELAAAWQRATLAIPRGAKLALLTRTGSRAYGTDNPDSDHDYRGVYIDSTRSLLGLLDAPKTIVQNEPDDMTLYELRHFCQLATKANPTALEVLWGDQYRASPSGMSLRASRSIFLSKRIRHTYGGYAVAQLDKAKRGVGGSRGQDHTKRYKFKLHTMRLLLAGQDALRTGEVTVWLTDNDLLAVQAAAGLPLDAMERHAREWLADMDHYAEASDLPDEPNVDLIDQLMAALREAA